MIFLTVGTQFPFDRLVKGVDAAVDLGCINEEIFAQIGEGGCEPRNFPAVPSLDKESFDECVARADAIISHAGMGSITLAMSQAKPLLVMPRLKQYGEVVNDHQVAIARKFAEAELVLLAEDQQQLLDKIMLLPLFIPKRRIAQPELVSRRVLQFLNELKIT